MSDKQHLDAITPALSSTESIRDEKVYLEDEEVFKRGEGIEDFRTVGWIHTAMIFLKGK